jgi:hypothetical protein
MEKRIIMYYFTHSWMKAVIHFAAGGGDIPTLETVPREGLGNILPGQGFVQQPAEPKTLDGGGNIPTLQPEGEPTLPVICSEEAGLELDGETGQCIPIEPEAPEQPEEPEEQSSDNGGEGEQSDQQDQQPSEDGGSSEDTDNGNSEGN